MEKTYDKYYQTKNLFGDPYPELVEFFAKNEGRGKLLDLGCGQGRDAIPLARMGYEVTGIDSSKVGVEQMNEAGRREQLSLKGIVADIHECDNFEEFDIILLDSMFHFNKKERTKETGLLKRIIDKLKPNSLLVVCIQNTGQKVEILNDIILKERKLKRVFETSLEYLFVDEQSNHTSTTEYKMVVVKNEHHT